MATWRPKGWFNEYENAVIEPDMSAIKAACLELGADRMLEALLKEGVHFNKDEWTDDATFETEVPGTVVFIPDAEDVEET